MFRSSSFLLISPTSLSTSRPFLKMRKVGVAVTLYLTGTWKFLRIELSERRHTGQFLGQALEQGDHLLAMFAPAHPAIDHHKIVPMKEALHLILAGSTALSGHAFVPCNVPSIMRSILFPRCPLEEWTDIFLRRPLEMLSYVVCRSGRIGC